MISIVQLPTAAEDSSALANQQRQFEAQLESLSSNQSSLAASLHSLAANFEKLSRFVSYAKKS
jgi:prefoldin subunit 5